VNGLLDIASRLSNAGHKDYIAEDGTILHSKLVQDICKETLPAGADLTQLQTRAVGLKTSIDMSKGNFTISIHGATLTHMGIAADARADKATIWTTRLQPVLLQAINSLPPLDSEVSTW
jgi:hypothetical protein